MAYAIKKTVVPGLMLALSASGAVLAQNRARDRARDPAADQDRISDQQRIQDRSEDRLADQDRLQREQDRVAAGDQPQDRSQEQLRQELHVQDQEQFRNRDIFGSDLMTREERSRYRERIQEMDDDEWLRFRAEHQARMLERAREHRVQLSELE